MLIATTEFWQQFYFSLFALLTCGFALAVLFSSNVVHMAFYLVLSLAASAGLFFLAGSEFVGAMQLMIYVGGTLVLLIFGVMLTAQAKFVSMRTRAGEWVLALIVGGSLLFVLTSAAFGVKDWNTPNPDPAAVPLSDVKAVTQIGLGLSGVRVDKLHESDAQRRDGMSGYMLPFVIVSMHLLVVLIGAAYLARTKKRPTAVENSGEALS
ncbi:MAG: NADH-quinone oxidoreductase subunit J [Pirellulaceae bacterium]